MTAPPLRVVYYAGLTGSPYRLLRHLATLATAASMDEDPCATEASLRWPHAGAERAVHLSLVVTRGVAWHLPIETLAGTSEQVRWELEALRRAEVVVFLVDGRARGLALNRRFTQLLAADLATAGRRPEDVPVLFQVHRYPEPDGGAAPLPDLVRALAWPRSDHVEAHPRERRGAGEALDRAIELHGELLGGPGRRDGAEPTDEARRRR
jgi:hypothetical protein